MNRYESILLDKIVSLKKQNNKPSADDKLFSERLYAIGVLIDCVCEFREPPRETPVEEGCGAMVDKGAK